MPTNSTKEIKYLDPTVKQEVSYCIPLWQRDLQIAHAIKRVSKRIEPSEGTRDDPIAVVCYGPSLQDTWEQIREFKYIITCSGSHKFLVERGIIPTWHVEVDPRPHKVELLGPPHKDVIYLPASACHPKYFDHLEGYDVRLWHVFDSGEDAARVLPRGEWAITGGSNVGLRAMTIARFFGFTNQHIFGMDGCEGKVERHKHAGPHPLHDDTDYSYCEYEGKTYRTMTNLLECARQTFHELDQMPDVKATFYGEGLVQAMSRNYVRKPVPKGAALIAFNRPELISAPYRELSQKMHDSNPLYGVGGAQHMDTVLRIAKSINSICILDYGCGKGMLAKSLPFPIWEYDPAIPTKAEPPRPADIVVCTHVLEHIEPDKLFAVLEDLKRCVRRVGYFVIHTGPAAKTLPDGRNTHLIQQGKDWWEKKLSKFFTIGTVIVKGPLLHIVVGAKTDEAASHAVREAVA